jgi:hypothetical protein
LTDPTQQQADVGENVLEAAERLTGALQAERLDAILIGGAAVRMTCERARVAPLRRSIGDLDYVAASGQHSQLSGVFDSLGYVEDRETNLVQGDRRLIFYGRDSGLKVDVFVGSFAMCHEVEITAGLPGIADVTSLVLTKLQVVELTDKDIKDLLALFGDHEVVAGPEGVDVSRVIDVSRRDWGLYTTITDGMGVAADRAREMPGCEHAAARIEELRAAVEAAEKSRSWKLRARIGRRKRWYDLPEEIEDLPSDLDDERGLG